MIYYVSTPCPANRILVSSLALALALVLVLVLVLALALALYNYFYSSVVFFLSFLSFAWPAKNATGLKQSLTRYHSVGINHPLNAHQNAI